MLSNFKLLRVLAIILYMHSYLPCQAQIAYLPINASTIKAYDVNSNTVLANIPVSGVLSKVIPNPDGTKVYLLGSSIQVLDVFTQSITNTINLSNPIVSTCISHDGQFLYFATFDNTYPYTCYLYKLNTQTNVVSYLVSSQHIYHDLCISPDDDKLYLIGNTHAIVFNTSNFYSYNSMLYLESNSSGGTRGCLNSDGSILYTLGESAGRFNIINTINYSVDTSCLLGPYGGFNAINCMQFDPIANRIYVGGLSLGPSNLISYNATSNQVDYSHTFSAYHLPTSLALNEEGTHCYSIGTELGNVNVLRVLDIANNTDMTEISNVVALQNGSKNFLAKLRPEIDIQGGILSQSIIDGDLTPSFPDRTDFGNVNTTSYASQTFKIVNTGLAPLLISSINLSGVHASLFALGALPSEIPIGGVDSFIVYFYPSSPDIKTANVVIQSNDFNEGIYDFAIQGTGTLPIYAYTTNAAANTVGVIDRHTNEHVLDINVGNYPNGICFNPSKSKLFVSNSISNNVSIINTLSNSVEETISVGNYPVGLCTSPDGTKLYVANQNSNSISVVNVNALSIEAIIPVGNQPFGVCVSLDGTKVFVSNLGSNTVSVINTITNAVVTTLNVGVAPKGITINPSGNIVYVANSGSNTVSSFNVSNLTMNANVLVGNSPYSICFNATGTRYYVSNYYDFTVLSVPIAGGFQQTIAVGNYPAGMSLNETGTQLWVTNYGSDNISIINTSNNLLSNTIASGSGPISFGHSIASIGIPEILVKGGNLPLLQNIENYDYTPALSNNTNFGQVNAGNSLSKTFYIQNTGSNDLIINNIDLYGPNASMFNIILIPFTIPAGVTDSFKIAFTPTSAGMHDAYIHITSNVPNLGNLYFGIQGEGVGVFEISMQVKLFLQGFYQSASSMKSVLVNQNIPSALPIHTDDVQVALMNQLPPHQLEFSFNGILHTDGHMICSFPAATNGNAYYIRFLHRNSIETWSKYPVTIETNTIYDFTTSASQAYGDNQAEVEPGIWAIYSGDIDQDGAVTVNDFSLWEGDANNFESGYKATDLDGDGGVATNDFTIWEANSNNFVGSITP